MAQLETCHPAQIWRCVDVGLVCGVKPASSQSTHPLVRVIEEETMRAESPDLAAAKQLLDIAKHRGFVFQRVTPGTPEPRLV